MWIYPRRYVLIFNNLTNHMPVNPGSAIYNIQWNLDNSKSKGPNSFVWIIETLNNWGLKCIHIIKLGLQNDFELLRILNYWSLNYWGSSVVLYKKDHSRERTPIRSSQEEEPINPYAVEPGYTLLCKQCRSRSVGFWRSQLIWICTVFR